MSGLEEEVKNSREDFEALAVEKEECTDQYEERIAELEAEVEHLSKDHEEELQQVRNSNFESCGAKHFCKVFVNVFFYDTRLDLDLQLISKSMQYHVQYSFLCFSHH